MSGLPSVAAVGLEPAWAHQDPVAIIVLFLATIVIGAKVGGDIASRLRQPTVLGELIIDIVVGNLTPAG